MGARPRLGFIVLATLAALGAPCPPAGPAADPSAGRWQEPPIPCATVRAVVLGRDLDGDGDPDEIDIHLEVDEIQEEVYPGQFETFWVFAPEGKGMCSPARLSSPTIRVEVGDHVRVHLHNTHYLPHTIHFHGTIHPNAMDGVPEITQASVMPGETFTYEFVAKQPGTFWYHCHVQPDVHVLMGLAGMFIVEPNRPRNNFRHLIVRRWPDPRSRPGRDRRGIPARVLAGLHGHRRSPEPHSGHLYQPSRDRTPDASRL